MTSLSPCVYSSFYLPLSSSLYWKNVKDWIISTCICNYPDISVLIYVLTRVFYVMLLFKKSPVCINYCGIQVNRLTLTVLSFLTFFSLSQIKFAKQR